VQRSFAVQFIIMGEQLLRFAMHTLTYVFFVGMAGSSIVVVISFVEDLKELLGEE
jgi:hypothetical protein